MTEVYMSRVPAWQLDGLRHGMSRGEDVWVITPSPELLEPLASFRESKASKCFSPPQGSVGYRLGQ